VSRVKGGFQLGFGGRRVWEGDAETDGPGSTPARMRACHLPGAPVRFSMVAAWGVPRMAMAGALVAGLSMVRCGIVAVGHDRGGVEDEVWRGRLPRRTPPEMATTAPAATTDIATAAGACAMGHAAMSIQRFGRCRLVSIWARGTRLGRRGRLVRSFFCRAMPISDKPFTIMDSAIIPKIPIKFPECCERVM